jgi:hypothetical protein
MPRPDASTAGFPRASCHWRDMVRLPAWARKAYIQLRRLPERIDQGGVPGHTGEPAFHVLRWLGPKMEYDLHWADTAWSLDLLLGENTRGGPCGFRDAFKHLLLARTSSNNG